MEVMVMRKSFVVYIGIIIVLLLMLGFAQAYTITDKYWGGNISNGGYANRDIVGDSWRFGIDYIDVSNSGGSLTIKVHGDYFSAYLAHNVYNMNPGDLFISTTGWDMGSLVAPYATDIYSTGQQWNYAFDLGDNYSLGTFGDVQLYAIGSGQIENSNINYVIPPGNNYIYRASQEWAFNPTTGAALGTGTWQISGHDLTITYGGPLPGDWQSWGFHWTEQCGNDSIEGGSTPVPEPATLLLLGSGLIGFGIFGRKRFRRKS